MIYAAKSVVENVERKAKSFALKRKRELKVVQGWLVTLTSSRELRVNNTGQFQACARGKSTQVPISRVQYIGNYIPHNQVIIM